MEVIEKQLAVTMCGFVTQGPCVMSGQAGAPRWTSREKIGGMTAKNPRWEEALLRGDDRSAEGHVLGLDGCSVHPYSTAPCSHVCGQFV